MGFKNKTGQILQAENLPSSLGAVPSAEWVLIERILGGY